MKNSKFFAAFFFVIGFAAVAQARPYHGTVRRVLDPITFQLSDGTVVRFLGVSGPERGSAHYEEAVAASRNWLEGQEVRFEYGLQERDSDGRWLVYVYADGVLINAELIKQGLALVSPMPNDQDMLPPLMSAEREAHEAERGQWSDTAINPFPVRARKATEPRSNEPRSSTSSPPPPSPAPAAPAPAVEPAPPSNPPPPAMPAPAPTSPAPVPSAAPEKP